MNAMPIPIISRLCACNCGGRFTPPASRPGQQYIFGHKPKEMRVKAKAPAKEPDREPARRVLDYGIAFRTAEREIDSLTRKIDSLDDEIAALRDKIKPLEAVIWIQANMPPGTKIRHRSTGAFYIIGKKRGISDFWIMEHGKSNPGRSFYSAITIRDRFEVAKG